jgi:hypothetical protein
MTKLTTRFLIMELAIIVWPPSICSRGGALLAYLILKRGGCNSKSREQREGAESIEGGQQEERSTSKVTPVHQKRMEAQASNFSF